jgi:hypothetical protein
MQLPNGRNKEERIGRKKRKQQEESETGGPEKVA